MLTENLLKALNNMLTHHTEEIEHLHTRLNTHAEDITEHSRRIGGLEQRHEGLVLAVAGLAKHEGSRTEELAERASDAYHERFRARVEREKLAKRIEQLERLLERGGRK